MGAIVELTGRGGCKNFSEVMRKFLLLHLNQSKPTDTGGIDNKATKGEGVHLCKGGGVRSGDRKSTRLNSSHVRISYAVFCLKKKNMIAVAAISKTFRLLRFLLRLSFLAK